MSTRAWVGAIAVERPGRGPMGRPRTRPRAVPGTPEPRELWHVAAALPATARRRYGIKTRGHGGTAGGFAFRRVTRLRRGGRPAAEAWVAFRRTG